MTVKCIYIVTEPESNEQADDEFDEFNLRNILGDEGFNTVMEAIDNDIGDDDFEFENPNANHNSL